MTVATEETDEGVVGCYAYQEAAKVFEVDAAHVADVWSALAFKGFEVVVGDCH